jgi:hypothetical protein
MIAMHENDPPRTPGPAKIRYEQGNYRVLWPGTFVVCAVSGERIPLDDLRYWNVERQEAYATAEISFMRAQALSREGA